MVELEVVLLFELEFELELLDRLLPRPPLAEYLKMPAVARNVDTNRIALISFSLNSMLLIKEYST